jgi:hypothetical protein
MLREVGRNTLAIYVCDTLKRNSRRSKIASQGWDEVFSAVNPTFNGAAMRTHITFDEVTRAVNALFPEGSTVEVRVRGKRYGRTGVNAIGFFNDLTKLAEAITACSDSPAPRGYETEAVYVTLNPVNDALLARAYNRMARDLQDGTSDKDIVRRRHFLVDADPQRPANISSSDEEKALAAQKVTAVRDFLFEKGWPAPVEADSGNGYHLIYDIDLPNDDASRDLIKACLASLAAKFDDEHVHIDKTVFNASRIVKAHGSMARKGDNVPSRPHRYSRILNVPESRQAVSAAQLQALAAEAPAPAPVQSQTVDGACTPEKFEEQLAVVGVTHKGGEPYNGGMRWILDECPFNSSHRGTSVIVGIGKDGYFYFKCSHNSCANYTWKQFREFVQELSGKKMVFRDRHDEAAANFQLAKDLIARDPKVKVHYERTTGTAKELDDSLQFVMSFLGERKLVQEQIKELLEHSPVWLALNQLGNTHGY